MQIDIRSGSGLALSDKVRAYVEYRMFAAASRFEGDGASVSVRLDQVGAPSRARFKCVATVDLGPGGAGVVSASAKRLHAAVDRAAEKLSSSVERRLAGGREGANGSRGRSRVERADPARAGGKENEL